MEKTLKDISQNLHDLFNLSLSNEKIAKNLSNINEALHYFPESVQNALIIKLITDWKSKKTSDIVSVNTEICRTHGGPCIMMFGVLSPDWPGLSNNCMGVINEICALMNEHPELKFSIEGHTDSDGEADFNQGLSEKRAESVRNAMIDIGIEAERLITKGFGETIPVAPNDSPEGKATNRRVEFVKM